MRLSSALNPWATAIIGILGLSLSGCGLFQSSSTGEESTSATVASDQTPQAVPASETEDGVPNETVAKETAASETAQDETTASDSDRIDHLLSDAATAEGDGELQKARELYARALEVDPGNEKADSGFQRVGATLGLRKQDTAGTEDAASGVAADAAEMTQVRRAQVRIEAESKIKQGEAALNSGEFDSAIKSFQDALMILRWNPYLEGGGLTENSLQARLDSAQRAKKERSRAEEMATQARIHREKQEKEDQERARVEQQIMTLYAAANRAFMNDRFSEAENYLTEILRLDPNNNDAAKFRKLARDARRDANERAIKLAYKDNWRKNFDEMAADLKPQTELLLFPDEKAWSRIARQGPIEFTVQDELMSADEKEITQKLTSVKVPLSFMDSSLTEAVDWFQTVTGVNFIISPTIIDSGDEPVFTVTTGPKSVLDGLKLLLEISSTPLAYRIQNGVVMIVTQEEAMGGQILEIYDIRDLAKIITNFPSKDFNLTPSGFSTDDFGDEGEEPQPLVLEADRLADLIRANISPETWELDPNNNIQPVSGALVVRQSREVQNLIRALLNDLRENAGTLINIESRFLTVSDTFLEDIGVDFRGLEPDDANPAAIVPPGLILDDFGSVPTGFGTPSAPSGIGTDNDLGIYYDGSGEGDVRARVENLYDVTLGNDEYVNSGGLSLQASFLDDVLVEAVLRAVSKYGTSNIVNAPSLTVFNGQRASLSVINNVSYVKDFDVEIAQAAVIAQPIVDVVQDGVVLDVRPVVSSDKRFVTMELRPTVAKLQTPIGTFTTSLAIGSDVTIELPVVTIQRARTTVTMPDGATLMIGGWKVNEDRDIESGVPWLNQIPLLTFLFQRKGKFLNKKKLIILVRPRIIIPEEGEPVVQGGGR